MKTTKEPLSDNETHEIADAIKEGMFRDSVAHDFNNSPQWIDEQLNKSVFTKKDLGINKLEIADGETLQKSIDRMTSIPSRRQKLKQRLLSVPVSLAYKTYLDIREALGLETHYVSTKYLRYFRNPLSIAMKKLNPDGEIFANGTYSEAVIIGNSNVMLYGAGIGTTIIDGGTTGDAFKAVTKDDIRITNLQVKTTAGGGNSYAGISFYGTCNRNVIDHTYVLSSDHYGIVFYSDDVGISYDNHIESNIIHNCDDDVIKIHGNAADKKYERVIVNNNIIYDGDDFGIIFNSFVLYSNACGNIIRKTGNDGIYIHSNADYNVITNNNIKEYTNEGVDDDSGTSTVADNEINA